MKLINVRLDAEDARRAAALKRAGIQLSQVVREAIRAEHRRRLEGPVTRRSAAHVMAEIYATYPDPPGLPPRDYDLRDPTAARQAVVDRLRRSRR